jgi:hypothetical protein
MGRLIQIFGDGAQIADGAKLAVENHVADRQADAPADLLPIS